jgi:hypothetical protein
MSLIPWIQSHGSETIVFINIYLPIVLNAHNTCSIHHVQHSLRPPQHTFSDLVPTGYDALHI